jgi:hypothetical protein
MAYGHAERTLAAIQAITIETIALLNELPSRSPAQDRWLAQVGSSAREAQRTVRHVKQHLKRAQSAVDAARALPV